MIDLSWAECGNIPNQLFLDAAPAVPAAAHLMCVTDSGQTDEINNNNVVVVVVDLIVTTIRLPVVTYNHRSQRKNLEAFSLSCSA